MTTRVALLTGGSTPERQVALAGAAKVTAALRRSGFEVEVIDTTSGVLDAAQEQERLAAGVACRPPSDEELRRLAASESLPRIVALEELRRCDVAFLVLHGRQGEGGELQTLLELAGVRFVGSDAAGSLLAMDKEVAKRLMRDAGVPTPDWKLWPVSEEEAGELGYPLIVKPSRVGSTVGLSVVHRPRELAPAVELALRYDTEVLLERFVGGRELTVGILDGKALAVGEIITGEGIFDYASKYQPGGAEEIFPAAVPEELATEVRRLGEEVHRILKLRDFSRIDFRLGRREEIFCLEANTLPGMTPTSLLPQSAAAAGIDFDRLCTRIVELALAR